MDTDRFVKITRDYLHYDHEQRELMEQRQTLVAEQHFDDNGFPLLDSLEEADEYRRLNKAINRCEGRKGYVAQTAITADFPQSCWIKVDAAEAGTDQDVGIALITSREDGPRLLTQPWSEIPLRGAKPPLPTGLETTYQ